MQFIQPQEHAPFRRLNLFFGWILVGIMISSNLLFAGENYVTVYNDNLALVKQVRKVPTDAAHLPIRFSDVAAQLIPTSVHLRAVDGSRDFQVLEQNFEYDLVSADKILEKYIDHDVNVITDDGDLIQGQLLSKSGNTLVIKTGSEIKMIPWSSKTMINVKDLPEGLITRPTLIWDVTGVNSREQELEVSYLTNGMQWHAEYVGVLEEKGDRLNLSAWVSVNNSCGSTFENAHLKLVAGEVHRAPQERPVSFARKGIMETQTAAPRGFEERGFFEYHIYDLDRPTTLKNNQTKQITLFPPASVASRKEFVYNARLDPEKVEVQTLFKNDKSSGLGMPLPGGVFRVYQKDKNNLEFIGEDRIEHTPRNSDVRITVGNAFDLSGERNVVERQKISDRSERDKIEIELTNHKEKEDVTIVVRERLTGRYSTITESNFPYEKKDADLIEFKVPVKADQKTTVKYTVTYSW